MLIKEAFCPCGVFEKEAGLRNLFSRGAEKPREAAARAKDYSKEKARGAPERCLKTPKGSSSEPGGGS